MPGPSSRPVPAGHLHPLVRDADRKESLHPDDVARTHDAVPSAVPGIPVGLSTGWWIPPKGGATGAHQGMARAAGLRFDQPDRGGFRCNHRPRALQVNRRRGQPQTEWAGFLGIRPRDRSAQFMSREDGNQHRQGHQNDDRRQQHAGDDHDCQRLLHLRADALRPGGRQQADAGDHAGHQHRA